MKRDLSRFPEDENGDILWRMHRGGDDLAKPREIDFSLVFPTEDDAITFAVYLLRNGQKVSFSAYEGNKEKPWQVQVHPVMEASHENITGFEKQLGEDASELGGVNDGWGCFRQDS